eukprot:scaffold6554_cov65-Phaeocystis_antarctica.AAC.1
MWSTCRGARGLNDSASAPARQSARVREACRSSAWHRFGAQRPEPAGVAFVWRGGAPGGARLMGTARRSRCTGRPQGECTVIIVECRVPAWPCPT